MRIISYCKSFKNKNIFSTQIILTVSKNTRAHFALIPVTKKGAGTQRNRQISDASTPERDELEYIYIRICKRGHILQSYLEKLFCLKHFYKGGKKV